MPKLTLILLSLLLVGCVDFQNQYAPSRARHADSGPDPRGLKAFVEMRDPASLAHVAWGINPAAFDGEKRKMEAKAALRFLVPDAANQKVSLDVAAADAQHVKVRVNGRTVGEFDVTGNGHFEAPVAANTIVPNTATLLEIESQTGLSLYRAGFARQ